MVDASGWRNRVESTVRTMVQPLVIDGGHYIVEDCDDETKTVVVRASGGDCSACVMSDDALKMLLEEALQRFDAGIRVTVVSD